MAHKGMDKPSIIGAEVQQSVSEAGSIAYLLDTCISCIVSSKIPVSLDSWLLHLLLPISPSLGRVEVSTKDQPPYHFLQ